MEIFIDKLINVLIQKITFLECLNGVLDRKDCDKIIIQILEVTTIF